MENKNVNYVHVEGDIPKTDYSITINTDADSNWYSTYNTPNTITSSGVTMTADFPKPVGQYIIGNAKTYYTAFTLYRKPSAWHRLWCKVFLGWTWRDI